MKIQLGGKEEEKKEKKTNSLGYLLHLFHFKKSLLDKTKVRK